MALHMTTVVGGDLAVLEHMLRHYKDIGIDSLLINVHLDEYGNPLYGRVRSIARRYRADIVSVFVGKWLQSVNPSLYRYTLSQAPNDWFLLADADELQVYPSPVSSLIAAVEAKGFDFVEGFVIDRIASDGIFHSVRPDASLWNQFPVAGLITFPLIHANVMKVVAAKGSVWLSGGQHYAYNGRGCPRDLHYIPVHHFKWTSGLIARLKARIEFYKSVGDDLWLESERVLSHCARYGERINIDEPAFMLRNSGITCPHETDLKAFVLANESKMPRP